MSRRSGPTGPQQQLLAKLYRERGLKYQHPATRTLASQRIEELIALRETEARDRDPRSTGAPLNSRERRRLRRAGRDVPASDRQKRFIAELSDERRLAVPDLDGMTMRDASDLIDRLLARPAKT